MNRRIVPVVVTLLLLLAPFLTVACHAQSLYQSSSKLLAARIAKADPDEYTFVVMGDSRNGADKFQEILKLARSFDPLFILHGGDYSNEGTEQETLDFLSLLGRSVPDIPLFVVIGNHEEHRGVFERYIGPANFTLSSDRIGFSLIALDNSEEVLRPPEQQRLRSELASASGAVFVAMHIPPKTKRWRGHTFKKGADELQRILEKSQVQGLFTAHSHLYDRSLFGGVPAFISGGAGAPLPWFSRYGERVHHILVVRVINGKANYQMVPLP